MNLVDVQPIQAVKQMDLAQPPSFLSVGQVARLFGVSGATIGNWVALGEFPAPHVFPLARPAWPVAEVLAFIEACKREG